MTANCAMGKNAKAYLSEVDVTTFLKSVTISKEAENPDSSGIGTTWRTRLEDGLQDGGFDMDGNFEDTASTGQDATFFGKIGVAGEIFSVYPGGDSSVGDVAYCAEIIAGDYAPEPPYDDIVEFSAGAEASGGVDRCKSLHPKGAETSTGDGTTLDLGASSSNGGTAYLHVFANDTPTSLDVIIEHSATGAFAGEEATLASFTQITTSNDAEKISFSGTVNRYVRASWTISGTSYTFAVTIHVEYA